jgi:hypothetical protein
MADNFVALSRTSVDFGSIPFEAWVFCAKLRKRRIFSEKVLQAQIPAFLAEAHADAEAQAQVQVPQV